VRPKPCPSFKAYFIVKVPPREFGCFTKHLLRLPPWAFPLRGLPPVVTNLPRQVHSLSRFLTILSLA
jgi:hypothetical protein